MNAALLVFLALARPIEVAEEWEIVSRAPLRELVTARAYYRRDEGPRALLPDAIQGGDAPEAFVPGARGMLHVHRGPEGWQVDLPPGPTDRVRVVARSMRKVEGARRFRVQWPRVPESRTPSRHTAILPRAWLREDPLDWTCPRAADDPLPCVSTARHPPPLVTTLPPAPSTPLQISLASLAAIVALAFAARGGQGVSRGEGLVGAAAGLLVGAAFAFALVGAYVTSWASALALGFALFGSAGALAPRAPRALALGAIALFVVPIFAVLDGRPLRVVPVSVAFALATAALALRAQLREG